MSSIGIAKSSPFDKFSFALVQEVLAIPYKLSSRESFIGSAVYFHSFKYIEVILVFMSCCWDNFAEIRIPDNNISIWANSNNTFLRVHVENLGSLRWSHFDELVLAEKSLPHSLCPNNGQTIFKSVNSIWYFIECCCTETFLLCTESAVISTHYINDSTIEVFHELSFNFWVWIKRGRHDIASCNIPVFIPKFASICS